MCPVIERINRTVCSLWYTFPERAKSHSCRHPWFFKFIINLRKSKTRPWKNITCFLLLAWQMKKDISRLAGEKKKKDRKVWLKLCNNKMKKRFGKKCTMMPVLCFRDRVRDTLTILLFYITVFDCNRFFCKMRIKVCMDIKRKSEKPKMYFDLLLYFLLPACLSYNEFRKSKLSSAICTSS